MYVNPWRYEIGDLVQCSASDRTLPLVVSAPPLKSGAGVIVDRRRREMYVDGRPIKIVELDEYCIVVGGTKQWVGSETLRLSQNNAPVIKSESE